MNQSHGKWCTKSLALILAAVMVFGQIPAMTPSALAAAEEPAAEAVYAPEDLEAFSSALEQAGYEFSAKPADLRQPETADLQTKNLHMELDAAEQPMALRAARGVRAADNAESSLKVMQISDTHLLAESMQPRGGQSQEPGQFRPSVDADGKLVNTEPYAYPDFAAALHSDRKMLAESQDIDARVLEMVDAQDPDVLVISGDLTKDGEEASHKQLAFMLEELKESNPGLKVYVINGNHDVNNADATDFSTCVKDSQGTATTSAMNPDQRTTPEEFKEIYQEISYNDAVAVYTPPAGRQQGGLSYAARPADGFTFIVMDSGKYSADATDSGTDEHMTGGALSRDLLDWAAGQTEEARARGDLVIGVEHHGLIPHFGMEPQLLSEYLADNYEAAAETLSDAGMSMVLTGHMHANDVASREINGKRFYDIETGSCVTYPSPVRTIALTRTPNADGNVDVKAQISTELVEDVAYNGTEIPDFSAYGKASTALSGDMISGAAGNLLVRPLVERILAAGGAKAALTALLEQDPGDLVVSMLGQYLPAAQEEGMQVTVSGIDATIWHADEKVHIVAAVLGQNAHVVIADSAVKQNLVDVLLAQVDSKVLVEGGLLDESVDAIAHAVADMRIDEEHTVMDLANYVYQGHLAGDEPQETPEWVTAGIVKLRDVTLVNALVASVVDSVSNEVSTIADNLTFNANDLVKGNSGFFDNLAATVVANLVGGKNANVGKVVGILPVTVPGVEEPTNAQKVAFLLNGLINGDGTPENPGLLTEDIKRQVGNFAADVCESFIADDNSATGGTENNGEIDLELQNRIVAKVSGGGIDASFLSVKAAVDAIDAASSEGPFTLTFVEQASVTDGVTLPKKETVVTGGTLQMGGSGHDVQLAAPTTFENITLLPAAGGSGIYANGYPLTFGKGVADTQGAVRVYGGAKDGNVKSAEVRIDSGNPQVDCQNVDGGATITLNGMVDLIHCENVGGESTLLLDRLSSSAYNPAELRVEGVDHTRLWNGGGLRVSGDATGFGVIHLGGEKAPYTPGYLVVAQDATVSAIEAKPWNDSMLSELIFPDENNVSLTVQGGITGKLRVYYMGKIQAAKENLITTGAASDAELVLRTTGSGDDAKFSLVKDGGNWSLRATAAEEYAVVSGGNLSDAPFADINQALRAIHVDKGEGSYTIKLNKDEAFPATDETAGLSCYYDMLVRKPVVIDGQGHTLGVSSGKPCYLKVNADLTLKNMELDLGNTLLLSKYSYSEIALEDSVTGALQGFRDDASSKAYSEFSVDMSKVPLKSLEGNGKTLLKISHYGTADAPAVPAITKMGGVKLDRSWLSIAGDCTKSLGVVSTTNVGGGLVLTNNATIQGLSGWEKLDASTPATVEIPAGKTLTVADFLFGKNSVTVTGNAQENAVVVRAPKGTEDSFFLASPDTMELVKDGEAYKLQARTPRTLTVKFDARSAQIEAEGADEQFANLIGVYRSSVSASKTVQLIFTPAVAGREFSSAGVNGEAQALKGGGSFIYEWTMPKEDVELRFDFTLVNKSVLRAVIQAAEAAQGGGEYANAVPAVQKKFDRALADAQSVEANLGATQKEIDRAWSDLLDAIHLLRFEEGDPTALNALLDSIRDLEEEAFTAESWQKLKEAVADAQDAVESGLKAEMEKAYQQLTDALKALEFRADFSQLEQALAQAEKIDLSDYLDWGDTKDTYTKALENARKLRDNQNAAQQEVDRAVQALAEAMAQLRLIPNKDVLSELIAKAEAVNTGAYTSASVAAMTRALNDAKQVLGDANATESDVEDVYTILARTMENLVEKGTGSSTGHSGKSSSRTPSISSNTYGAEGRAVVGAATAAQAAAGVLSDTTVNFTMKRGAAYCFKMTVVNGDGAVPGFTVGNGAVLRTQFVAKTGDDYYYRVYAVGAPGQSTGVYTVLTGQNAVKHCAITIA